MMEGDTVQVVLPEMPQDVTAELTHSLSQRMEGKQNSDVLLQHCCPDATPFTEINLDKQQD